MTRRDAVVLREAGAAAGGGRVLGDEDRMAAVRGLAAVVAGLRRSEALRDQIVRVLLHRRRPADQRDRAIAAAGREVELRAEPVRADRGDALLDVHLRNVDRRRADALGGIPT